MALDTHNAHGYSRNIEQWSYTALGTYGCIQSYIVVGT